MITYSRCKEWNIRLNEAHT